MGRLLAKAMVIAASAVGQMPGVGPAAGTALGADIIVTSAPAYEALAALGGGERFPRGAQLLLLRGGRSVPLVAGFAASADASVSFDGRTVVFAGRRALGDPWRLWEVTLATGAVRRVAESADDAIRPRHLPAGRIVYAHRTQGIYQLETARIAPPPPNAELDGLPPVLRISYLPAHALPVDVLRDGRILFETAAAHDSGTAAELYLVYSDGSGVESYRCDHGRPRWGGSQLASGDVIFTHGDSLGRFSSPLAAETAVNAPPGWYAGAIAEAGPGVWLVSHRAAEGQRYTLARWRVGAPALVPVLASAAAHLIDPAVVAARPAPKRHPSALHDWRYANLLALDVRRSRAGALRGEAASVRLDALDAAGNTVTVGTAPVADDGSFYVKVPPDRPLRFAVLDDDGAVLRQEKGWFWIRRGEQRICVGCHAGPESAPDNRVPDVLLRSTRPANLSIVNTERTEAARPPGTGN